MHRFFILSLTLVLSLSLLAQTHVPRYTAMTSKTKAYYEYLPEGYDAAGTTTYPLILFMTGIGEFGNGSTSQLPYVLRHGVPQEIEAGVFPKSFTVGGQVFRFIVITPQWIKFPRPEAEDMDSVLNYIVAHYKVDLNRIYITGLSYGGGMCWAYTGSNATFAKRIAAIVPVASPVPDGGDSTIYARSRVIAANTVAVYATHNLRDQDDTVATTIAYVDDINQPPAPTPVAKKNIFNAGGHDAWTRTYDPARKEFDGLNAYEWMLQYKRNIVTNQAPTANAGPDQSITLPTNSITLSGSGVDKDGSITSYAWTKIAGPTAGNITTPGAATTTITGLVQGTYVFRLTVTDNNGATATDDVNVIVNAAPNTPPQADAGSDQSITLPANSVTLTGSGTDGDGSITTYAWMKVSGPPGGTITSPNAATTTVTALQQGSYVFRLTVTDNQGATASDDITVTVTAAPNQPPTANAGSDQSITLPTNSVTLSGTGTDNDGSITGYNWTKVSGPTASNITTANAATTTVSGLVQGTYMFRLTVTDNNSATATDDVTIVVNAAPNAAPQADAGVNQTITLPTNSTTLNGSGTDADGSIATYAWTKISGTAGGTITTSNAATTTVTALQQGSYVFRLTVTDNDGATAFDDVTVVVNAAPNYPPTANAGIDQTITLPTNSITLTGNATDNDGTIASYAWTKVSGSSAGVITNPASATTTVTGLTTDSYTFRLTVKDNNGATASDDVIVTVNPAPNVPPTVDAGADQTITLPDNRVTLSGTAADADGTIGSYAWTKIAGPDGGTIATPDLATTTVSGLLQGTYTFRLTVMDNDGATSSDDVIITVNAAPNQPPAVDAGADQTITLPDNTVTLSGTATDADGTIAKYTWTKVTGPANGNIATPDKTTTAVNGLVQGAYTFRLTVTDNDGATAYAEVTVTVNAAANKTPTVDAGTDIAITLPVNQVNLTGSGADEDGNIASYLWTQVSGPVGAIITTNSVAATSVTGLVQGSYTFRLTVTDNNGATASDDVTVTVNAAPNQTPVANAGTDITITLPVNTATLTGSGTDADGSIANYTWTKVSGPARGTITTPNVVTTTVTNLQQGTYVFRLTVADNDGATASDDVTITVNAAANQIPTVDAGTDQTITLPQDSLSLSGTVTDPDGNIASYSWAKVSGPTGVIFSTPENAATDITGLAPGVYVLRLTATDNNGATAFDEVTITVLAAVANHPPHADAGADQHINLPANSITLHGIAADDDGSITAYLWTKIVGPAGGTIATPNSDSTVISALQQGSYIFRLTVTDNKGDTASDDITVVVSVVTAIGDDPATTGYKLLVAPNPSPTYFSLKLLSSNARPVFMQVTDALGRMVEQRTNLQRNSVFTLGQQYRPGAYYVQVVQAGKKVTVRLLKLP